VEIEFKIQDLTPMACLFLTLGGGKGIAKIAKGHYISDSP
jgi:hypothetical protein